MLRDFCRIPATLGVPLVKFEAPGTHEPGWGPIEVIPPVHELGKFSKIFFSGKF